MIFQLSEGIFEPLKINFKKNSNQICLAADAKSRSTENDNFDNFVLLLASLPKFFS
jgi:hypothetical protein